MKMHDFDMTIKGIIVATFNMVGSVMLTDVNKYLQTLTFLVGLVVGIMTIIKLWKDLHKKND